MSTTIYRGFKKVISFSLKDAVTKDDINLTEALIANGGVIKGEIVTPDFTSLPIEAGATSTIVVIGSPFNGKFDVTIAAADATQFTKGSFVLQGQCDFGVDRDPIEWSREVLITDLPV